MRGDDFIGAFCWIIQACRYHVGQQERRFSRTMAGQTGREFDIRAREPRRGRGPEATMLRMRHRVRKTPIGQMPDLMTADTQPLPFQGTRIRSAHRISMSIP